MNTVEIDISEHSHTILELLALSEGLALTQLIDVMVKEYTGTDMLANLADFATSENRADRAAALSARRAAITAIKGESQ